MRMPWTSEHTKWFEKVGEQIITKESKTIDVWEYLHQDDEAVLSAWAKHFRNHYCLDSEIDYFRRGYCFSRSKFLNNIKFPDPKVTPGPSIRAGDFGEILVADFLEYIQGFWVPRTRYGDKTIRNESTKGSDIIGVRLFKEGQFSPEDTLALFESKTQFSGIKPLARLQDAVDGSSKDLIRKAESLNAIKQRLYGSNDLDAAIKIERFQNEVDNPYREVYGAVALFEDGLFDSDLALLTDTSKHPASEHLVLVVIRGKQMMDLAHELYRRAADEA